MQQNNNIDPLLAIAKYKDSTATPNGADPGIAQIPELAQKSVDFFINNSQVEVALPVTTALSENITDINTARNYVISQTALGYMTISEGMDYYNSTVGTAVNEVLKSLNNK